MYPGDKARPGYRALLFAGLIAFGLAVMLWSTFGAAGKDATDFLDFIRTQDTDKFGLHRYECLYAKYLPLLRVKALTILEIGLGCGVLSGSGWRFWTSYFRNSNVIMVEYDADCARRWRAKATPDKARVVEIGDQADKEFMRQVASKHGLFDIIIDDGGHTVKQQMTSFHALWPSLKPGGLYFLEDLRTNFGFAHGGNPGGTGNTTVAFIAQVLIDIVGNKGESMWWSQISNVECCDEICVFRKFYGGELANFQQRRDAILAGLLKERNKH